MVPLPFPDVPEVIVSQSWSLVAVQVVFGPDEITLTDADAPAASMFAELGLSEKSPYAAAANSNSPNTTFHLPASMCTRCF
jgi:hypothetical protein